MSADKSIYALRDVSKVYNQRTVLNVEALDILRGEILAVVGPSGAGKSTLLRLLNLLEAPTAGQITFAGYIQNGSSPPLQLQRRVTTVFQRPVLLRRSVFDNVAFGLKIRGEKQVRERVMDTLTQVRLEHMADAPAKSLSGGEAQRVALARALAIEPTVLLLDEPTANLDPGNVGIIEKLITTVNQSKGVTIVLVTHNIFQARRLAHRTALILSGQIIEIGPTQTIFNHPADPRTAAFVRGEMIY